MAGRHIPTYSSNIHTHQHAPNHNFLNQQHTSYVPQQSIPPQYTNIHSHQTRTHGVPGNSTYENVNDPTIDELKERMRDIEKTMQNVYILGRKSEISYDLDVYPFDTNLYMPAFPPGYVSPKFTKYRGKTNPIEHVHEFATNCMDIAYKPTYLMRLFSKSLVGQALEWFSTQKDIQTWDELK